MLFFCNRSSKQIKERNIKIKIDNDVYSCPTDGKETILDFIKKKIEKEKIKKNTNKMLLKKSSKGYFINLGLPTGVLEEGVVYECIFKPNKKIDTDTMMRDFRYDDSGDIKYFYVKFDKDRERQPSVSSLSKFVDVLQVPFCEGESFFDALTADKRFDKKRQGKQAISMCQFKNEEREIFSLKNKALQDMVFEFYNSKADRIEASEKKPLPTTSGPSGAALPCVTIKQEPGEDQLEETQAPAIEQSVSSDNSGTLKKVYRWSKEEKLKSTIEKAFGLDFQPKKPQKAEDKRMEKINNFCCEKFSLDFKHHILVADMKDLVTYESRCVGATIAVKRNHKNEIVDTCAAGTCFRIGKQFVITNAHVLNLIEKHRYQLEYINFNYTGHTDQTYIYNVEAAVLLKNESLDYAILKLKETEFELPPSITDFNYQIALPGYNIDEPITFIGHPGGSAKLIDPSCPLKLASQDPDSKLYIRQQEKNRSHYDVSTFFKGSSGSPGFLLHSKKVVVLHSWGYDVGKDFSFEEGILMSSIVEDVKTKLEKGLVNGGVTLADIFGEETAKDFEETTPMETDS